MELEFKGLAPEMGLFGLHARFFKFDIGCSTDDCRPPKLTTEKPETTSKMPESTTTAGGDTIMMFGNRLLAYFITILFIISLNSEI